MIAIVMTYYNRQYQLNRTLQSMRGDDVVVIVVDDCSPVPAELPKTNYPTELIRTDNKKWTNPEPAYNIGINAAMRHNPDIIIIQNAECIHVGGIIDHAKQNVTNENYIAYSCFSIDKSTTYCSDDICYNEQGAKTSGELAWYNHPVHRPVGFEFCAAISADNMKRLNGYDERLADGLSFGDCYLLHRIKKMGLRVEIPKSPYVIHQWHEKEHHLSGGKLRHRNKLIYEDLIKTGQVKAVHKYTPDICES